MAKKSIGLSSVMIAPVAADGGMGTVFTTIGATVRGSAAITTEEGETTSYDIEESDTPFFAETTSGAKTFSFSSYDVDPIALQQLLGGTVNGTTGAWEMPDTIPNVERSVQVTTKDGWVIRIVRGSLFGRLQWNLQRTALAQVDVTVTILAPTKANTRPATFTPPA